MTVNLIQGSSKLKVVRYQNEQLDNASLSYNHVSCFMPDPIAPEKYMWVATKGGGLNKMDLKTGKFIRYSKDDGLPDMVVYGILADNNGNIWGSTNKGIFCMMSEDGGLTYIFRNFSKADGLQEEEFNTDAFLKLPDGRLAFGGVNIDPLFPAQLDILRLGPDVITEQQDQLHHAGFTKQSDRLSILLIRDAMVFDQLARESVDSGLRWLGRIGQMPLFDSRNNSWIQTGPKRYFRVYPPFVLGLPLCRNGQDG